MVMPQYTSEAVECDFCAETIARGQQHVCIGEREEPWHISCAVQIGIPIEDNHQTS